MLKWAVELSRFNIIFEARKAIKAQALAHFLAENIGPDEPTRPAPMPWNLYVDGSSTTDGSGAGLIVKAPNGTWYEHTLNFQFKASNNEAKYEALIMGIELCHSLSAEVVHAFSDSQLVVSHLV